MDVNRRLKLGIVLVAMACLAMNCGALAGFEISGDLDSGVVFGLRDLPSRGRRIIVEEFIVWHDGEKFWHLRGKATVRRIVYGQAPAGLVADLGPTPLRPNKTYSVVVRGKVGWLGLYLRGRCRFTLDNSGRVQPGKGCVPLTNPSSGR